MFSSLWPQNLFYGWWIVAASALIVFLSAGTFFYGFSLLVNPLTDEFGWSRASISIAFSLRTEVGGVAAPLAGFLVDRVGARILMLVGIFIVSGGFALLSTAQSLWFFYVAVVIIAIGMSSTGGTVPNVLISHWFRRRRGRALGFLTMGGAMSGLMAVGFAWLIGTFGWRDALLIAAAVQLMVATPLAYSIRNRPQDIGQEPDGIRETLELADTPSGHRHLPASTSLGMTTREALRSSVFWRLAIAVGLGNFATTSIIVHQVPFLTESAGMSDEAAALSVTIMTLLSISGRLGLGYAADSFDKRVVMSAALLCVAVAMALFSTVHHVWQLAYVLPIFAIGQGGVIPVRTSMQAEYFGLRAFGSIQGLALTVATFGAFAGPVLAGYLYDVSDSYRLAFVLLAIAPAAGIPLTMSCRQPRWADQEPEAAVSAT